MSAGLSYAAITPARDEAENLPRLAASLAMQTVRPTCWIVVDNGSSDGTAALVEELALEHDWIRLASIPAEAGPTRAEPTVRAFTEGLRVLGPLTDLVVKLDADVSFAPDYFERMLGAFEADTTLGIASGSCYERQSGEWRQRHVTRGHVWGASRAYRKACLEDVLPLESGLAWDGIDELKAGVSGWQTRTCVDLPFYHHRPEGSREASSWQSWRSWGVTSHYMGYRFGYLVLRTLHYARRDPSALGSIWGFALSATRRAPRYPDPSVRAYLRRKQSLRNLPLRIAEAFGHRA